MKTLDQLGLIACLAVMTFLPASCFNAFESARQEATETAEKTARLEQKSGMVWPAELDLYMSDQGYTAIDVPGDTKTFPHTEIRKDAVIVWRVYARTYENERKIEYFGPPGSRYRSTLELDAAIAEANYQARNAERPPERGPR